MDPTKTIKKRVFAIHPSENSIIIPSKRAMNASMGLYEFRTKKPANIPLMSETITSLVIIAKMIVSSGIAIDNIPYSITRIIS
jgi:hypothetical protein